MSSRRRREQILDAIGDADLRQRVATLWGEERYTPMSPHDPAWALTNYGNNFTVPEACDPKCFICRDPEFAELGMMLCRDCKCGTHVPADDGPYCSHCEEDVYR